MTDQRRLESPGRLSGPGELPDARAGAVATTEAPAEPLAQLAARYNLTPSAARPAPLSYIRQLWQRRHFIMAFATARTTAMYSEARLGQLWQLLTPLLNAAVYFLIFGVILNTKRGVPNFPAFLVTGIFIFTFTQRSFIIASRVIHDSLPLIRAIHFPRACLPLGYIVIELQQLLIALVVLVAIVLGTGEPVTWYWLLVIPALALQTIFNVGAGLILARIGAQIEDVSQLLPFIVRTWMYASGVMFSILTLSTLRSHLKLTYLMQINPAAVYISLTRFALLRSQRLSTPGAKPFSARACNLYYQHQDNPRVIFDSAHCHALVSTGQLWLYGIGWALLALVAGFFIFWGAEVRYGRG